MPSQIASIVGVGATYERVSFRMIDRSGDKKSESLKMRAGSTDNDVDNLLTAYAAGTNANIYEVEVSRVWAAAPNPSNALLASVESVQDAVVITYQKGSGETERLNIHAPVRTMFIGDTDNIDTSDGTYADIRDAGEALIDAAYEPVSVRFTEHKETNIKKQPA